MEPIEKMGNLNEDGEHQLSRSNGGDEGITRVEDIQKADENRQVPITGNLNEDEGHQLTRGNSVPVDFTRDEEILKAASNCEYGQASGEDKEYHNDGWELFVMVESEKVVDAHRLMSYFWGRHIIILEKYADDILLAPRAHLVSEIYRDTSFVFENMISREAGGHFDENIPSTPAGLAKHFSELLKFTSDEAGLRGLTFPPSSLDEFVGLTLMDLYGNLTVLMERLVENETILTDDDDTMYEADCDEDTTDC